MVLISQVWIQHLPCTQIIGYCYLRVGSVLEPDLAFSLYTALVTALAEIQKVEDADNNVVLSGVYGYRLHKEGIGIFAIQNEKFRVILLCEGFIGHGIPYLTGDVLQKINKLFIHLNQIITDEECRNAHFKERDEPFWWNLVISSGLGEQIQIDELITEVYPLRFIHLKFSRGKDKKLHVRSFEDTKQGSLGYGWQEVNKQIANKVQVIFDRPHENFLLYQALFHQIGEFKQDFSPNTLILTFQRSDLFDNQLTEVTFLSFTNQELKIQFCLPLTHGFSLEGSRDVYTILHQIVF